MYQSLVKSRIINIIKNKKKRKIKMKFISIKILCLAIFVNFTASTLINRNAQTENINDLRYPKPVNITSIFPFRVLKSIFNMTSIDMSLERGSNRITSQVSAVVDVLRRVLRYMVRNALSVSPLRTNQPIPESTTVIDINDSRVSIDLPVFTVVNETITNSKNESINII
ncbi:hypothetical protein ACKWTF_009907 [Chironomus riparius]